MNKCLRLSNLRVIWKMTSAYFLAVIISVDDLLKKCWHPVKKVLTPPSASSSRGVSGWGCQRAKSKINLSELSHHAEHAQPFEWFTALVPGRRRRRQTELRAKNVLRIFPPHKIIRSNLKFVPPPPTPFFRGNQITDCWKLVERRYIPAQLPDFIYNTESNQSGLAKCR